MMMMTETGCTSKTLVKKRGGRCGHGILRWEPLGVVVEPAVFLSKHKDGDKAGNFALRFDAL